MDSDQQDNESTPAVPQGDANSVALVPFSYGSPFHNPKELAERFFDFGDFNVRVKQAWVPDGKGGTDIGFGAAVYEASFLLSDWLSRDSNLVKDKRVLELGSGVGLVSIVAAKLGAENLVATDGDAKSLNLTQENCALNCVNDKVDCKQLMWGDPTNPEAFGDFDVILASDIIARPYREHFPALRETLLVHTRPGGLVIIAQKPRSPHEQVFMRKLVTSGEFALERCVKPELLHADFVHEDVSIWVWRRLDPSKSCADAET